MSCCCTWDVVCVSKVAKLCTCCLVRALSAVHVTLFIFRSCGQIHSPSARRSQFPVFIIFYLCSGLRWIKKNDVWKKRNRNCRHIMSAFCVLHRDVGTFVRNRQFAKATNVRKSQRRNSECPNCMIVRDSCQRAADFFCWVIFHDEKCCKRDISRGFTNRMPIYLHNTWGLIIWGIEPVNHWASSGASCYRKNFDQLNNFEGGGRYVNSWHRNEP